MISKSPALQGGPTGTLADDNQRMVNCAAEVRVIKTHYLKFKCLMNPRCNEYGLGDGSVGKVCALHAGGPGFNPPELSQLCQAQWHGLVTQYWEVDPGGSA